MPTGPKRLGAKREILHQVSLFRTLTDAEIDAVASHASTQSHPRGSAILRKGDPTSAMMVILQGRTRISASSEDGRDVTLQVRGPGEVLGEVSLLDGRERSADVCALEDCVVLCVERAHFMSMLHNSSDLCLRLMNALCDKIRRTTTSLEEAFLLDLPSRLGRQLQRMAQDYGVVTPQGIKIGVRLSQSDLAALVGASREKVNKQLRLWESAGLITKEGGYLVMLRPEQLSVPIGPI